MVIRAIAHNRPAQIEYILRKVDETHGYPTINIDIMGSGNIVNHSDIVPARQRLIIDN
jgi:hypothetical protein